MRHTAAVSPLYVLLSQPMHEAVPLRGAYKPRAQARHVVCRVRPLVAKPGGHSSHVLLTCRCPAAHVTHSTRLGSEMVPSPQRSHCDACSDVVPLALKRRNCGAQSVHCDELDRDAKVPLPQSRHAEAAESF